LSGAAGVARSLRGCADRMRGERVDNAPQMQKAEALLRPFFLLRERAA
jgi:hypothetical protein